MASRSVRSWRAVSIAVSVLALIGIGASLIIQAREARMAREHASRSTHTELLRMAMENPLYRACWGPYGSAMDEKQFQQFIYTNLIMSFWEGNFEVGGIDETHLRAIASTMFAASPGRRFWADMRELRMATAKTRRARRFHATVEAEYQKSILAGAPVDARMSTSMAAVLRKMADFLDGHRRLRR